MYKSVDKIKEMEDIATQFATIYERMVWVHVHVCVCVCMCVIRQQIKLQSGRSRFHHTHMHSQRVSICVYECETHTVRFTYLNWRCTHDSKFSGITQLCRRALVRVCVKWIVMHWKCYAMQFVFRTQNDVNVYNLLVLLLLCCEGFSTHRNKVLDGRNLFSKWYAPTCTEYITSWRKVYFQRTNGRNGEKLLYFQRIEKDEYDWILEMNRDRRSGHAIDIRMESLFHTKIRIMNSEKMYYTDNIQVKCHRIPVDQNELFKRIFLFLSPLHLWAEQICHAYTMCWCNHAKYYLVEEIWVWFISLKL